MRVKRVLDVCQQKRQRIGYRYLCSLIIVIQKVRRCGTCHESNRFLIEDTASTEHAVGFTKIAILEWTIPYPLNEEVLPHLNRRTVVKGYGSIISIYLGNPGKFGEGRIRDSP